MVKSQIGTLTPDFSSGHNLCYKYWNVSYKPILDIYISRYFQWYKNLFSPMSFDSWNPSLKIRDSIGFLTPKVGIHLRCVGSFPHTFSHSWEWKCESWVTFSAHTYPCLCLDCKPKARVMTSWRTFCCKYYYKKKLWIHDIGGQLYSRILTIFAEVVIGVKKLED
jgi:hypothetical protein